MKTCSLCHADLPVESFNKKTSSKDGLQNVCRVCNSRQSREYYSQNKDKHKETVNLRNKAERTRIQEKMCLYLKEHPCVDCGESDIVVLEFDHLGRKDANVSDLMRHSWNRILQEMHLCEVVCANCHKRRTAQRMPTYRSKYLGGVA